jgi:hypothetical protein
MPCWWTALLDSASVEIPVPKPELAERAEVHEEQSEPRKRPPSPRSVRAKTASFAYGSVSGRPPLAEIVTSSRFPGNASARFEAKALRNLHPHRSGSFRSFAEGGTLATLAALKRPRVVRRKTPKASRGLMISTWHKGGPDVACSGWC